ncbi:hypothetical protein [Nonomuraea jabiensis]|uniref:Secreted protein n=1 Tax=Nonomuraea jabiensis TaxID=882448 RepID=A0A7W9GE06_9ACTN|nr:hypothetical protein [Nonomuraea jabiensis]MBB5782088.1 hypothetical protein [Nonomuraea jabiensis]
MKTPISFIPGVTMSRLSGKTLARTCVVTVAVCVAAALGGTPAASAQTGSAGLQVSGAGSVPDTCRSGYVWRGARAIDHVCVSPADRDRTARENATGVWHDCSQGFVWREAYPGDYRCVVPGSRSANWADNASAPYRLAWVIMTRWHHDAPKSNCPDGVGCSTNESDYATVGVRGYYLTPGAQVAIQIIEKKTGARLWSGRAIARTGGKGPEGSYDLDTGNLLCQGGTFAKPYNADVQARQNNGPWSPKVPISFHNCSHL